MTHVNAIGCKGVEVFGVEILVCLFLGPARHQLVAVSQLFSGFGKLHVGTHIIGHLEVDQFFDEFVSSLVGRLSEWADGEPSRPGLEIDATRSRS